MNSLKMGDLVILAKDRRYKRDDYIYVVISVYPCHLDPLSCRCAVEGCPGQIYGIRQKATLIMYSNLCSYYLNLVGKEV